MRLDPHRSQHVGLVAGVCALFVLTVMTTGCGGPSAAQLALKRDEYVAQLRPRVEALEVGRAKRAAQASEAKCRQHLGRLVESLQTLESKLTVGLSYGEYRDEVGNVRVQYDRVVDTLGSADAACVSAAVPAEDAMNAYIRANQDWSDCLNAEGDWSWDLDEYGYSDCTTDDVDSDLQLEWSKASTTGTKARRRLDAIGTHFESPVGCQNSVRLQIGLSERRVLSLYIWAIAHSRGRSGDLRPVSTCGAKASVRVAKTSNCRLDRILAPHTLEADA